MTLALAVALLAPLPAAAQSRITTPKEHFGFNMGDDYKLATYTQFESYWRKLATQSNRMKLVEIGRTAENRPQLMAIISSPANLARLEHYRSIASRLARAEGVSEDAARALAREGKAVVWIDGGLHSTEVLGATQLIETSYQLLTKTDAETRRFLDDVIILAVHANPDGMELVSDWYMREPDTLKRNTSIPRLYQKYVGHDNNRDFYMSAQAESRNINHVLYRQWYPQIVYNHHQTGPAGTVMFAPPFRDPFNYNYDPLVVVQLDLVGAAMHSRFEAEGKPGVTMRSGATYSTWWNGGLRTTPYFHNMVGLLTETIGHPTPTTIPFIPEQQLPRADLPYPIAPQRWHFRQSVDYSVTANRAVLDIASRQRENFLFNAWRMGRNSIERGNRDTWTSTPTDIEAAKAAIEQGRAAAAAAPTPARPSGVSAVGDPIFQFGRGADPRVFTQVLRAPGRRDARGYILSADQRDFLTATKFVNTLWHNGVTVHRATAPFVVAGKRYPRDSYVVMASQAFRPMVLDSFEPQDHPNDFAYPGGPPKRPYDNAGYTLAYQMGVQFDRILDGFDGPFQRLDNLASPARGTVTNATNAAGFLVSHATNDAWIAVNRALKANGGVHVLRAPLTSGGRTHPAGTFYITATPASAAMLAEVARSHGLSAEGTTARVPSDARLLRPVRIALWDQYGGSMPSGHTRFLLEQFEFPYELVYPRTLDAGNLASRFDVILLPSGAVQAREGQGRGNSENTDSSAVPAEFRDRLGRVTVARTVPQLRQFLEAGGTIVAVGSSSSLGMHMGLPMSDAITERAADGTMRALGADKFYVPGSILRVRVDTTQLAGYGMPGEVDVVYDNSPTFRLDDDAAARGVQPLAWFTSTTPLRSGWAWGQSYLNGTVAAAQATVGKGTLLMFGPEITFRAQPHGTFKWLFNGIHAGGSTLTP